MKARLHAALRQQSRLLVWTIFSGHSQSSGTCASLSRSQFSCRPFLHEHSVPSSDGHFQRDNAPCCKSSQTVVLQVAIGSVQKSLISLAVCVRHLYHVGRSIISRIRIMFPATCQMYFLGSARSSEGTVPSELCNERSIRLPSWYSDARKT